MLVLLRGLPGSGKSTLAQALAPRIGAVVLNKDAVRAALFPGETTEYTTEQDDFVIGLMLEAARWHLRRRSVILDGRVHGRRQQVERIVRFAHEAGAELRIIECRVPRETAITRVSTCSGHPAKNRDAQLVDEQIAKWEPLDDPHLVLDTTGPLSECLGQVIEWLQAGIGTRLL